MYLFRDDPCYLENGGCSQICELQGEGFLCKCEEGFELLENGECVDIDECAVQNGLCSHNCTNFEGGYICECPLGEALHVDGRTCGKFIFCRYRKVMFIFLCLIEICSFLNMKGTRHSRKSFSRPARQYIEKLK